MEAGSTAIVTGSGGESTGYSLRRMVRRRAERRLIEDYLGARQPRSRRRVGGLPDMIQGFRHVKARNDLLNRLEEARPVQAAKGT